MKRLVWLGLLVLSFVLHANAADLQWVSVEQGTLEETLRLDGEIEAVQHSTVSAQTTGVVTGLPHDVDDAVEAGELIVQLDDSEQQARVAQARGSLQEAEAGLNDAEQRYARIKGLYDERQLVSRATYDEARTNLEAARGRMDRAQAALAEAQEQLSYTRVTAPYSGIVTEQHIDLGEVVSPGTPLISGLSLEALRVVANLPQQYASFARERRHATIQLPDGRVLKTGNMTFYPYASTDTHTFRVRMPLKLEHAANELFPGMLVKVDIPVATRSALWIPASALVERGEMRAVYVRVAEGLPRLRQVRIGTRTDTRLEILSGLAEDEKVAIRPDQVRSLLNRTGSNDDAQHGRERR